MTTPIPTWVGTWLVVIRDRPEGCWVITGKHAFRVDPVPMDELRGIIVESWADNDNRRVH